MRKLVSILGVILLLGSMSYFFLFKKIVIDIWMKV